MNDKEKCKVSQTMSFGQFDFFYEYSHSCSGRPADDENDAGVNDDDILIIIILMRMFLMMMI